MDIFWNIFETLSPVFEAFMAMRFVLKIQNYNFSHTKAKLNYIYASLGYGILIIVLTYFVQYEGLVGAVYVIYLFVISALLVESKILLKLFVSVIEVLIALAISTLVSGMLFVAFNKPLNEIFSEVSWMRFFGVVIVQFLKILIYDIIIKITNKDGLGLGRKEWTLIIVVFGLSFVTIALIQTVAVEINTHSTLLLMAETGSIIVAAVCFYMTVLMNKTRRESERLRTMAQQELFRTQYAQNVKKQYEEISQVRHDMKQTNAVVMELLLGSKTDEAIEYMRKMTQRVSEFDVVIDTGNDYVNAILNAKLSEAKRRGITVLCSADKNAGGIDEVDLCNLLGNLLDNAIEACEKCNTKQKVIEIKLRTLEGKYLLDIENTAEDNALENNQQLLTTKGDKLKHGYGVKSIKSIAEKYNGMVNFSQVGERFRSTVILSINE